MKKMIRYLSLILSLASVISFAACGKPGGNDDETTDDKSGTPGTTAQTEALTDAAGNKVDGELDANGYRRDELPDSLDYNDKKVTFLVWDGQSYEEYFIEAPSGETVTNALYSRNLAVEERLGVKLDFIKTAGGSGDVEAFTSKVNADIMAGDQHEYDMISAYSRTTAMCAYNGYTRNLLETAYFNEEMPWWPDTLMKQSTMNGKLYFCSGDISLSLFHNLDIIYLNKELAKKYGFTAEELYTMVNAGEWTIDQMIGYSKNTYTDLNSDGKRDDMDQYGFIAANTQSQPLIWGCGITAIDIENGRMIISPSFTGEKMQGLQEKIFGWLYSSEDGYFASSTGIGNTAFAEGRCLFFSNIASYTMSKFNVDGLTFGILPPPKYDNAQENYYSVMGNAFSLYAILNTKTDADMCSAVLECMGSEGYRQLSPAIFEEAMKVKYASDDLTSQMYDVVRAGVVFDNGRIFSAVIDDLFTKTYNSQIKKNSTAWMSAIEAIRKTLEAKVESLNTTFEAMN